MLNFNWVDYIFLIIFLFSVMTGIRRGLVKEIMSLVTLIAAFIIASLFCTKLAAMFASTSQYQAALASMSGALGTNTEHPLSVLTIGGSFIILFVLVLIVGSIIGSLLSTIASVPGISFINRVLGGLFGLGRGFLINLVLIFILQLIPQVQQQSWWTGSTIVTAYQPAVQWLGNMIQPGLAALKTKVSNTMQNVSGTVQQGVTNAVQSVSPSH